jgi:hypothetical protein
MELINTSISIVYYSHHDSIFNIKMIYLPENMFNNSVAYLYNAIQSNL